MIPLPFGSFARHSVQIKANAAYIGGEIAVGVCLQMGAVRVKAKWCRMFLDIHETVLKQRGTMLKL